MIRVTSQSESSIPYLEDLGAREAPVRLGDELDCVLEVGEHVDAGLDAAVAALAQHVASEVVGVLEAGLLICLLVNRFTIQFRFTACASKKVLA